MNCVHKFSKHELYDGRPETSLLETLELNQSKLKKFMGDHINKIENMIGH